MNLEDILFAKKCFAQMEMLLEVCAELSMFPWEKQWENNKLNILANIVRNVHAQGKHIVKANADLGYLVDDEGLIHCVNSSSWIWQFDGCKESEIEFSNNG